MELVVNGVGVQIERGKDDRLVEGVYGADGVCDLKLHHLGTGLGRYCAGHSGGCSRIGYGEHLVGDG